MDRHGHRSDLHSAGCGHAGLSADLMKPPFGPSAISSGLPLPLFNPHSTFFLQPWSLSDFDTICDTRALRTSPSLIRLSSFSSPSTLIQPVAAGRVIVPVPDEGHSTASPASLPFFSLAPPLFFSLTPHLSILFYGCIFGEIQRHLFFSLAAG